jgi:hypothetical protein
VAISARDTGAGQPYGAATTRAARVWSPTFGLVDFFSLKTGLKVIL